MPGIENIELPDIGDFDEVEVIEILVNVGDKIDVDDSIITLESDKASMEIPTPRAGIVTQINVNLGDKIKQGDVVLSIQNDNIENKSDDRASTNTAESSNLTTQIVPVVVPDIGDFDQVEVIEILVNPGDDIAEEDSIITLESDKASMEIPTPIAGKITNISVSLGDKISLGDLILELETTNGGTNSATTEEVATPEAAKLTPAATKNINQSVSNLPKGESHASPSIRKLARELGVDLSNITGTGQKGRVLNSDLKGYVKQIIASGGTGKVLPTETLQLSRINKLSGKHLSECWLNIPHVTQFDEVNIDQMESFRQEQKAKGVKLTPLVFIMKGVVQALKHHPRFNASLDESGESLIIKKYFNLGIAMDTPNGLVVPVIHDVDKKSLTDLAKELAETSAKARDGKLRPADMQGAGFTISSLGGIGGTHFTPIVNAPEVAILGVSRSQTKPVWDGKNFIPTLTLPLSLSYDHRVVDGAQGARFMADLNSILQDIREILL